MDSADQLEITPVDPADDALVDQVAAFLAARDAFDAPWRDSETADALRLYYTTGWDGDPDVPFVGRVDGRLVVYGDYNLPSRDNLDAGWLSVVVAPAERRQGYGTRMLRFLEERIHEIGRTKLGSWGMDTEANLAFAAAHGYAAKSAHVTRRQYLQEVDPQQIEAAFEEAAAHATDYELLRIYGRTPEDLVNAAVTMVAAINDAPLDDLDYDDEVFDAERLRTYEQGQLDAGHRLYRVVARHRATGELAGHTVVTVDSTRPHVGDQHDTSVLHDHRGHRLGLWLKAEMIRWLREAEPQVEHITTGNAESNAHMIAVNERLGYRVLERGVSMQKLPADAG